MLNVLANLRSHRSGAVAPMVALSMFALIGAGGIAFDYARVATLDTELQQAADQAALAAATQLDRTDGARDRATSAITAADSTDRLAANLTRFANDGNVDGTSVEIQDITFCSDFDDSVADTTAACDEIGAADADGDKDARFVVVTTRVRTAEYALTPIVGAFAGDASATAVAGIESSICNVAPLLVCAPNDDFPTSADIGKGIVMKVAGGNSWAPGNYGYLDFGNGNQGVLDALLGNGLDGCQNQDDNETEPGNKNATDAINTRMDVYAGSNKASAASCDTATGAACPSKDTRKDMKVTMTYTKQSSTQPTSSPACGAPAGGKPNQANGEVAYGDWVQDKTVRQFGRDTCHYEGDCPLAGGDRNFGDGDWDRAGYIAATHPTETADSIAADLGGTAKAATLTRYQVYQWELANAATALGPQQISASGWTKKGQNWSITKVCKSSAPIFAPAAADTAKDRRILPIVAANCDKLKGKGAAFEDYIILRVFDVFLTEPSLQRAKTAIPLATATVGTDDKQIYGEVIGPAQPVGGTGGFQYYSRSRPYLVR